MDFPLTKTKTPGVSRKFDLTDLSDRRKYFQAKAGPEIKKLRQYLKKDAFIGYMLAKKQAGKGTYARMLIEVFGSDLVHLSVGDVIRQVDEEIINPQKRKELEDFLRQNYRGFHSVEEVFKAQKKRSTKGLAHSAETILTLLEREISRLGKKALLIDGFPRGLDQVSYSLFFRELVGYREDPDFFVLIQIPEAVIDERMKSRVACPKCHAPRSLKLLPTKKVEYDRKKKEFYLRCDNPNCQSARLVAKEGDELGIENIRSRLTKDGELVQKAFSLHGIPKILLRNAVPVNKAKEYADDYEITPQYSYSHDKSGKITVKEDPWIIKDDQGVPSYSLLAPAVVLSFIKQMAKVLAL